MKKIIYGIVFFILIISQVFAEMQRPVIDLILPTENPELEYISKKLSESDFFSVKTYIKNLPPENQRGNILIIVSDKLLPLLKEDFYQAKFGLYVNSISFNKIKENKSSALFSDQSLHRQLLLLTEIFKKKIIVSVPYFNDEYENLIREEEKYFKNVEFFIIKTEKNNLRSINKAIQNSDVLLATPEQSIYNRQTVRGILLSSYRHQTPVIGPNEGFVTAGALASVTTSSDQYIDEIISMLTEYIQTNTLPESRHPRNFLVKVNKTVAESFRIELPSENQLHTTLEKAEK